MEFQKLSFHSKLMETSDLIYSSPSHSVAAYAVDNIKAVTRDRAPNFILLNNVLFVSVDEK